MAAAVLVASRLDPNPDRARTTPGWATLTGPSRPMMSASLVLLACWQEVERVSEERFSETTLTDSDTNHQEKTGSSNICLQK